MRASFVEGSIVDVALVDRLFAPATNVAPTVSQSRIPITANGGNAARKTWAC